MELSNTRGYSTAPSNRSLPFSMQRTTQWFGLLFFFALLWSLVTVTPTHAAQLASAPDMAQIDAFITSAMQEKRIPGVGLAVVNETHVLHVRGFGRANEQGEAVTAQTPFMIGSSSKSFTALAIMQLVEAGKVELDAPVQRYLPWWHLADPVQSSQVTVAELLHQTSGLPATLGGKEWLLNPATQGLPLETGVRSFASVPFAHSIGSFTYSNANYETLSLLVQTVSGEAFGAYLKHHIFAPLSMTRSTMSLQEARQEGLQQGYTWRFGFPQPVDNVYSAAVAGAGMITSTAEDMAHYLRANMGSGSYGTGRVLSPQGIAILHTGVPQASFDGAPFSATGHYAMGWINGALAGVPTIFHFGTVNNYASLMVILPQRHLGAVLLMNINAPELSQEPIEYVQSNLTRLLAGEQTQAGVGLNIQQFYLIADVVLLLFGIGVIWAMVRLPHWFHTLKQRLRKKPRRAYTLASLRIGGELLFALGMLISLPRLFPLFIGLPSIRGGIPWPELLLAYSDISGVALVFLLLILLLGGVRGILLVRVARHHGPPSSMPTAISSMPQAPALSHKE